MSTARRLEFWAIELPAYLLAALAAFFIGAHLLHWALGLGLALAVVFALRALGPIFSRLLGQGAAK